MHRVEYIEHERHFKKHAASAIGRWKKWAVQSKEARTSLEVAEDHFARYQLALSVKMLHEHAEWTHAIRRAGRWFLHMETMTRLRRWKLYVQYRREKNAAREEAEGRMQMKLDERIAELTKEMEAAFKSHMLPWVGVWEGRRGEVVGSLCLDSRHLPG